jgi:hypothetical protein
LDPFPQFLVDICLLDGFLVDPKEVICYNVCTVNNKEHKMSNLTAYVDRKNSFAQLFGGRQLSLQNAKDRQAIAASVECELSPENLTCDGELSPAQTRARHKQLIAVAKELIQLDPSVKFYDYS